MFGERQARSRTLEVHRDDILTESALVVAICAVLVVLVSESAPLQLTANPALQFAFSISAVLFGAILLLGIGIGLAKRRSYRRMSLERELKTQVVDVITRIARDEAKEEELAPLFDKAPELVEDMIAETMAYQRGSGVLRVASAAKFLGLPASWRRRTESGKPQVRCIAIVRLAMLPDADADAEFQKGLDDPEELVALESARALIHTGRPEVLERVLSDLPRQTRLVRALLCEWLRKHATTLSAHTIPMMLCSEDPEQVLTGLEVLSAWRRALLIPDLKPLLQKPDPAIRAAAWEVVPYALGLEPTGDELTAGLRAPEPAVRAAAWNAVARMRLKSAIRYVPENIRDSDPLVSLAVCYAAGVLGLRAELEQTAVSGVAPANAAALEAMEKMMIGRLT
jgi:HEAT repeat protein